MALSRYPVFLKKARWAAAAAAAAANDAIAPPATVAMIMTTSTTTTTNERQRQQPFPVSARSISSSPLPRGGAQEEGEERERALFQSYDDDVGQPTHETHPELLAPGELAPGVSPREVASRREKLAERILSSAAAPSASTNNNSFHFSFGTRNGVARSNESASRGGNGGSNGPALAVLPSPLPTTMAGVIPYPYRPDADFYYLTGVAQPGCVAVVVAADDERGEEEEDEEVEEDEGKEEEEADDDLQRQRQRQQRQTQPRRRLNRRRHRFVLFVPDEDPRSVLWDGRRLSPQAARSVFGADEAYRMSELHSRLGPLLSSASLVLLDDDRSAGADLRYSALLREVFDKRRRTEGAGAGSAASSDDDDDLSSRRPLQRRHHHQQLPSLFQPLRPHVHTLRWIKSAAELALMRRSAEMAAAGMRAAMAASRLGGGTGTGGTGTGGGSGTTTKTTTTTTERRLASAFEHACKSLGADRLAYPPVVAGGPRACTIHYSRNDARLGNGDWVLVDAGCEFFGYCSDVSRAWPIVVDSESSRLHSKSSDRTTTTASSLFSTGRGGGGGGGGGPHAELYAALLEVHAKCVAAAVPGSTLSEIHALSVSLLADAAAQLAGGGRNKSSSSSPVPIPALRGLSAAEIAGRGGRQGPLVRSGLYPHAVGHWLGLDTHDAPLGHGGAGGAGQPLVHNVVLTIEPGLYFPPDPSKWGRFAGVGMRLEDDVAVVDGDLSSGPEVLSSGAPLLPEDVARAIDGS